MSAASRVRVFTPPPTALAPRRNILTQYGFRIDQTGAEWWGRVDLHYGGANSVKREHVEEHAREAVKTAANLGVELTYTLLARDHLTTSWSRWLDAREVRS